MNEFLNILDVVSILKGDSCRLIGIDGICGIGKSTLAEQLSDELNYYHINLDDYLEKKRIGFVEDLRFRVSRFSATDYKS